MSDAITAHRTDPTTHPQESLLRTAFKVDVWVTSLAGVLLLFGSSGLDSWMGVNAWVLAATGVTLVALAVGFALFLREPERLRAIGRVGVALDAAWIVVAILLVSLTDVLTAQGEALVLLLVVYVSAILAVKLVGLRRMAVSQGQSAA